MEKQKELESRSHPICCFLDLTLSSNLLITKIADIPHKLKYETILAPIFEYCFGTSDQDQVWRKAYCRKSMAEEYKMWEKNCLNNSEFSLSVMNSKIDWIRDETFLYSQIFKLTGKYIIILAMAFGLWNNRKFILDSCHYTLIESLKYSNERFKNDRELVQELLKECPQILVYASDELRNDKEIVKQAITRDGSALQFAAEFQDDKEIVMLALESSWKAFMFASKRLRKDRDVVCKAVSLGCTLRNVDKSFYNDRELLLMSSKIEGYERLFSASSELRNDKELVMQAIQDNPKAFGFASYELRNDSELVKEIVMLNGEYLIYASEELRDDKELVELALKTYPDAIHHISDRLRKDTEFISKLIGKRGFKQLPKEFSNDREIVLESIKIDAGNLKAASLELQNDREFILKVVKKNGKALKHVNDEFKSDREIVMAAVSQNGDALSYMPDTYFKDTEIILKAAQTVTKPPFIPNFFKNLSILKKDKELFMKLGPFFQNFPRKYQLEREIVMECVKTNPKDVIELAYPLVATDRVLAMRIVKRNGLLLGKLPFKYRNDRELVSFAIQQNKEAFKFVSEELSNDFQIQSCLD